MHHALLYISLPSLYDYNVKVPNDFLFVSPNFDAVLLNTTPKKFANI